MESTETFEGGSMDFVGVLRLIIAAVAASLLIVKLVHKDKHTAFYWGLVTFYWVWTFIEHLAA